MWHSLQRFFVIMSAAFVTFGRLLIVKRWPEPVEARERLEKIGGIFVKLGQMLALRPDQIPEAYIQEFLRLLDRTSPLPFADVASVFLKELGKSPDEMFASFEREPLASASFGQVHRAVLKTGEAVAVKVQRPGLNLLIRFDLALFAALAKIMDWINPVWDVGSLAQQLRSWTFRELDYRSEAGVADYFYRQRERFPGARFPKVYKEFTTKRILVTEFIPGRTFTEIKNTKGLVPEKIKRRVAELLFRHQLTAYFLDGVFHGDPHPSNLILTDHGEIAYVDFGIFGEVALRERKVFAEFMYAVVRNDIEAMVTGVMDLSAVVTGVHPNEFFSYLWKQSLRFRPHVPRFRAALNERLKAELAPRVDHWQAAFNRPREVGETSRDTAAFAVDVTLSTRHYGLSMPSLALYTRTVMIMQTVVESSLEVPLHIVQVTRTFFEEHIEAIRALPEPVAPVPQNARQAEAREEHLRLWQERREIERELYFEHFFFVLERLVLEQEA